MVADAERNVNVDAVERVSQPTRDVLVVRALDGDRTFAGFGKVLIYYMRCQAFNILERGVRTIFLMQNGESESLI